MEYALVHPQGLHPQGLRDASLQEYGLWLLRQRRRFRVSGPSMMPFLQPGEEVLIDPAAYRNSNPDLGDVVVAEHPKQPGLRLVKRVIAVLDTGDCLLIGDNPDASTDSRNFGAVSRKNILGKVISRF